MPSLQGLYGPHAVADGVAEGSPDAIPEKLVRCLWFDQEWRPPRLYTLSGRAFTVLAPGAWNLHAGPDFQRAVVEFSNGERDHGDVEVHCYASGWTAHRHHLDARYNRVILHVVLWNDRPCPEVSRSDGRAVPQVALAPLLPRPLAAYQAEIVLSDYPSKKAPLPGRCFETLRGLPRQEVQRLLERAGEVRLWQHAWRWAQRAAEVGLTQVMYEAVLRALGSSGYRQPFQALARDTPWDALQGCLIPVPPPARGEAAEALLLGLAGLLPLAGQAASPQSPPSRRHLRQLHAHWQRLAPAIGHHLRPEAVRRQPHARPANTPERRLAGMAQLLAHYHDTTLLDAALACCRPFMGRTDRAAAQALGQALTAMFTLPAPPYRGHHARPGSPQGKPQRLIGRQRALTIVVDAVLPVLLLYAHHHRDTALRDSLLAGYRAAPRLPDNHLLRHMVGRLLGRDPTLRTLVTGARQQQGLLQVFHDFCGNDEGDCQQCGFPLFSP